MIHTLASKTSKNVLTVSKQLDCMALKVANLNKARYIEAEEKINQRDDVGQKNRHERNSETSRSRTSSGLHILGSLLP